ncbi:MAG: septum formation initiator family protein [bacterium]
MLKNKRFGKKTKLGIFRNISISILCALMFATIFFLYLGQINSLAGRVYEIQKLESEMNGLESKNESIKLEIAQLKSMDKIEERIAVLDLVKSEEMVYLQERDVVVAVK